MDRLACPQEIELCGRWFVVARSLDIARRLEPHTGPLRPFSERLDSGAVTHAELVIVYSAMLHGQRDAPDRSEIEAWVFEVGLLQAARQVAWFVLSLTVGNDMAMRLHEKLLAGADAARREAAPDRRPFGQMDGSTGRGSSTGGGGLV